MERSEQVTISAELLSRVINLADDYHKELEYWYGLAEDNDGGSANSFSATVYHDYGDYDNPYDPNRYEKALNEFKGLVENVSITVRNAKEILNPRDKVIRELKEKIQEEKTPETLHKLGLELASLFEENDDGKK